MGEFSWDDAHTFFSTTSTVLTTAALVCEVVTLGGCTPVAGVLGTAALVVGTGAVLTDVVRAAQAKTDQERAQVLGDTLIDGLSVVGAGLLKSTSSAVKYY